MLRYCLLVISQNEIIQFENYNQIKPDNFLPKAAKFPKPTKPDT